MSIFAIKCIFVGISIELILCLAVCGEYGTKKLSYGEGCNRIISIVNDMWEKSINWGNILLRIIIWCIKGSQITFAIGLFSVYRFFKAAFVLVFKKRG